VRRKKLKERLEEGVIPLNQEKGGKPPPARGKKMERRYEKSEKKVSPKDRKVFPGKRSGINEERPFRKTPRKRGTRRGGGVAFPGCHARGEGKPENLDSGEGSRKIKPRGKGEEQGGGGAQKGEKRGENRIGVKSSTGKKTTWIREVLKRLRGESEDENGRKRGGTQKNQGAQRKSRGRRGWNPLKKKKGPLSGSTVWLLKKNKPQDRKHGPNAPPRKKRKL